MPRKTPEIAKTDRRCGPEETAPANAPRPPPRREPTQAAPQEIGPNGCRAEQNGDRPGLVIVESPKKAKSIGKFLGSAYIVKASMGHVRDFPKRKLGLEVAGLQALVRSGTGQERDHRRPEAHRGQAGWSIWRPTPTAKAKPSPGICSRRSTCAMTAFGASRSTRSPSGPSRMHSASPARSTWRWSMPSRRGGSLTALWATSSARYYGRKWVPAI